LSHYLKQHRAEYYDRLTAIRNDGDWEGWLKFFVRGVLEVSRQATETARSIVRLREDHCRLLSEKLLQEKSATVAPDSLQWHRPGARRSREEAGATPYDPLLLEFLFEQPIVTVRMVEQRLNCVFVTANKVINRFARLGLLEEVTGYQRNRRFRYAPYLALFEPAHGGPMPA
jgi:Fic family protein